MKDFAKQRREGTKDDADADDALEEARANATRGVETFGLRPRPFRLGCAVVLVVGFCLASTFAVAVCAAVCAHRWGIS